MGKQVSKVYRNILSYIIYFLSVIFINPTHIQELQLSIHEDEESNLRYILIMQENVCLTTEGNLPTLASVTVRLISHVMAVRSCDFSVTFVCIIPCCIINTCPMIPGNLFLIATLPLLSGDCLLR